MNLQIDPCNIAAETSSLINVDTFLATSESDQLDARLDRTSVTQHRFRNQSTLGPQVACSSASAVSNNPQAPSITSVCEFSIAPIPGQL